MKNFGAKNLLNMQTESSNNVVHSFDYRFINASALIIKVTNRCNLRCKYCYEHVTPSGSVMELQTFKQLCEKICTSSINSNLLFIFHGGEPTLVDVSWYREAIDYARGVGYNTGKEIKFGLQTNLIAVPDSVLLRLKDLDIQISASIDAGINAENPERILSPKALFNLNRAINLGLSISILSTINKSNFSYFAPFMQMLEEEYHVRSFKANVAYAVGLGKYNKVLSAQEIFTAKKDITNYMMNKAGHGLNEVNVLQQINKYFSTEQICNNSICDKRTCGAGKQVLGVTHLGDLLPCGRFSWNEKSFYLGSIYDEDFKQTALTEIEQFHEKDSKNWAKCSTCRASAICNYGCQAFIQRSLLKENIECSPTQLLYDYFKSNEMSLRHVYDNNILRIKNLYSDYSDSSYSDYR